MRAGFGMLVFVLLIFAILNNAFNLINDGTLFFDDFNDNEKDFSKWKEIYTDGIWEEKNGRAEFQLYEPGSGTVYEGIESIEFSALLNPYTPLTVNWDLITDAGSTNWAGRIYMEITDGTNWIWGMYHRFRGATMFMDSNDEDYTVLAYRPDGSWSNTLQIFSDRYIIDMGGDTKMVYDNVFPPAVTLKLRIYIANSGSQPQLYMRSAFDNIVVTYEEPPSNFALIFGRIENLSIAGKYASFDAIHVTAVKATPPFIKAYGEGEKIGIIGRGTGVIGENFVFGVYRIVEL